MRGREVRLEFERPAIGRDGFIEPMLAGQGQAEVIVGGGVIRFEFDGATIRSDGFLEPALVLEDAAENIVGLHEIRFELESPAKGPHSFPDLTPRDECDSQIKMGLGMRRVELKRPAISGQRFFVPVQHAVSLPEIRPGGAIVRLGLNGLANQLDRQIIPAGLVREHPEEMQSPAMIGLHGQNLPVHRLRFRGSPCLMVLKGEIEGLLDRGHGWGGCAVHTNTGAGGNATR